MFWHDSRLNILYCFKNFPLLQHPDRKYTVHIVHRAQWSWAVLPVLTWKSSSKIYSISVRSYVQKMHFLQGVNLHINHSFQWLLVRSLSLRRWLLQYSDPGKFIPILKRNYSLKKNKLVWNTERIKSNYDKWLPWLQRKTYTFCKCSTIRLIFKLYLQHTLHTRSSNILIRNEINLVLENWTNNSSHS